LRYSCWPRWIAWLNRRSSQQALYRVSWRELVSARERRRPAHRGRSRGAIEWNETVKGAKYPNRTGHRLWLDMRLARPSRTLLGHMTVLLRQSVTLLAAAARGVRLRPRSARLRRNHNWSKAIQRNPLLVSRGWAGHQQMARWPAIRCRTRRALKHKEGPIGRKLPSRILQSPMTEERGRTATYHARPISLCYRPDLARQAGHYICCRVTSMTRNRNLVHSLLAELCLILRLSALRRLPHRV